jgi:hypothetical protein
LEASIAQPHVSVPGYEGMPSNDEMFGWIETMWEFGDRDRYGWRMPGTRSDHQASAFLEQEFREAGLQQVRREAVSIPVHFPEYWSLTLQANGTSEEIPCSFIRYAAGTPPEGVSGNLVFAGRGSKEEFQAKAREVAGHIAVVELYSDGYRINYGNPPIWTYDPNRTLAGDMYSETYPVDNQPAAIENARLAGAIGLVCILTFRSGEACVQYHGPKNGNRVITALSVSPSSGEQIKNLLAVGPVRATLVLTENPGTPPPGGPTRFGTWGVTHNVYGVLPGTTDEVVVMMSHHDGGAVNEASGPAVLVAIAHYFAQLKEKRRKTLMFFVIGSHFGLRPPLLQQARGLAEVRDRIACVLNVEMIARQYKLLNGRYVATGLAAPTMWGVRNANPRLVNLVQEAVSTHDLDRSYISDRLLGEGATIANEGGIANIIESIALNAQQFSLDDRPETVNKEMLGPMACAYSDMIERLDAVEGGL